MIKRIFDIFCSFFGVLIMLPLFILIAVLIKMEDKGPVFYLGERVGKNFKLFKLIKFRTMSPAADSTGVSSTPIDDPRITSIGHILRSYKLDELPQLLNVLKGDMSLVGPRPQVLWAVNLYTPEERQILSIKPGITDYASIKFRNEGELLKGSLNPDKDYLEKIAPEKLRLALLYLQKRSIVEDIKIILQTIKVIN